MMGRLNIKRIYDPVDTSDGYRILIDRLWPRGVKKEAAHVDLWLKNIAPTGDLRKWFDHDPEKWVLFNLKYQMELKENQTINELQQVIKDHPLVTLLYAARDGKHNHAIILKSFLTKGH